MLGKVIHWLDCTPGDHSVGEWCTCSCVLVRHSLWVWGWLWGWGWGWGCDKVVCVCYMYVAMYVLVCVVHVHLVVDMSGCTCVYSMVQTVQWAACSALPYRVFTVCTCTYVRTYVSLCVTACVSNHHPAISVSPTPPTRCNRLFTAHFDATFSQ